MSSAPVCRACGLGPVALRGKKPGAFLRREFEFHACAACGFMQVEPFSGFAIYDDAYYRGAGPDPYVDYAAEYHDWRATDRGLEFADLVRIADERLRDQKTKRPKDQDPRISAGSVSLGPLAPRPLVHSAAPLRWLDFGCGAGGFLKFLRARGAIAGRPLELTGHDVGSYADLLRERDNFRILGLDALAREPDGSFDLISLIEVIEHLPEPLEALRLVGRLLKPGGLLLLTTGNLDSPAALQAGLAYRYCAPEIHVSLFNPRALTALYRRAGLDPIAVRYDGAVQFKVVKTLRHRPILRVLARAALCLPPIVRFIDRRYGVSAMPCAVKPGLKA
ncbi:MAG: class I SAM-dependent methyltransferase [Opitutaceae bacterium]|nr:class I SAM-dependent methyltransferase [Opitutaceae bacterium]